MMNRKRWVGSEVVALAVCLTVLMLLGFLLLQKAGSAIDFGMRVTIDLEAEEDIRHEFGDWIPNSVELQKCAFAVVGVTSDTGEHAVFTTDPKQLVAIAERFSGQPIDKFDSRYSGNDRAVDGLELDFPADRAWKPARIRNGRFCEVHEWTSENHGSGRFVAIDDDRKMIFLLKWTK